MNFEDWEAIICDTLACLQQNLEMFGPSALGPSPNPRTPAGKQIAVSHIPRIALGALIAILCIGGYLARFGLDIGGGSNEVPSRALTYNISQGTFEDDFIDFPFSMVGYISSLEGIPLGCDKRYIKVPLQSFSGNEFISHLGKLGKSSTQNAFKRGYVSSQEGIMSYPLKIDG